jgi:hypothetical protein
LILSILLLSLASVSQPVTFYPCGIGGGGSLYQPCINPGNDDEFYVACDMSGFFHSTDFGNSYSLVPHTKLQAFGTSTYEFTSDPDIAYSNFNDGNSGYPVKTSDGGASWNRIAAYDSDIYGQVYRMSAHYGNSGQLLINSYGDILFSDNGGVSFSLVKHTDNMGAGLIIGGVLWDGSNIYIGTNNGLIKSTNSGQTFAVQSA